MRRKKKKAALRAVFAYLLLSGGIWMFINSYANSYNRLSGKNIVPASMAVTDDSASIEVLDHRAEFSLSGIMPESKAYCAVYLLAPDEIRAAAYVISLCRINS
ncbi:MAG: hypothetical protein K6G33_08080 [Ruminococcus sp.]|uniref:hypothetical protein n=1 Tax=Ruminococcus sp. TaxID=41978 RepID=UPI0025F65C7D|nr:hypothetical protein [Ruminococcus sp.]MCR5600681.1 hypothetical protein [Ruminococcus sp.]